MKKSAIVALVVFGVFPFSACNNGEQTGYMETSTADANAREAEQAEQQFADLADQDKAAPTSKVAKHATKARTPSSVKQTHAAMAPHVSLWVVQMGAFKVKENAEKLTVKLKAGGFPVVMRSMNHSKNGEIYLVHLEPTPNKTEAEKWQTDLKLKEFDSTIVSHRD